MKIGIYDKWLSSLGGGEKVATVMGETLSRRGHNVDLISGFEVDKKELEDKMGTDLSKVNLVTWYERSYDELMPKTRGYDIFINVSFLDHLPSEARKSIYYVHFPTPIKSSFLGFIKYETILPLLRKYLIIPEIEDGIRPLDDVYTRGGRWLASENTIVFSNTPKAFKLSLRIYAEQMNLNGLKWVRFDSPNSEVFLVDRFIDHNFNVMNYKLAVKSKSPNPAIKIYVDSDLKTNALGLVSLTIRNPRYLLWNLIKKYLPRYEMALYGSRTYKVAQGLDTYDLFLANSEFTKVWTKKYLGKRAKVLNPPVDTDEFRPGKKKNMILSVGRFFVGGHSKRQDVLVKAFKTLIDDGVLDKSWELHFVGGVASGKDNSDYLKKIRDETKGYKIYFHLFADFSEVKKLYAEAKIYWHATGFGEDEKRDPIKFEHFGITVVESMAAGCVPVVFRGGGLTETVGNHKELTWKSVNELKAITTKIASDDKLRQKYSRKLPKEAEKYSVKRFSENLIGFLRRLTRK